MTMRYFHWMVLVFMSFVILNSCDKDSNEMVNKQPNEPEPNDTLLKCNGFSELCDKRLDEITILMTHNSFNNAQKNFLIPNQDFSIYRQLTDGVRGLMLDIYSSPNGPLMYHGIEQGGKEPLLSGMRDIRNFLNANPNEVVVIIFENYCTHEEIMGVVDSLEMSDLVYIHNDTWPTLKEMIEQNKRLVLMVEKERDYLIPGILYAWEHTFDTNYKSTSFEEMNCSISRGKSGLKTFYLLNHWISTSYGLPVKNKAKQANSWEILGERVKECSQENQKKINFVGVDFYNLGDALAIVDSMNGVHR